MSPEQMLRTPQSPCRWKLDPRGKLLACLAIVLSVVTVPKGHWHLLAVHAALVLSFILISGVKLLELGKRLAVILPLLLVVAFSAPFMATGSVSAATGQNVANSSVWTMVLTVGGRALLAVAVMTLLILTTPFRDMLKAFQQLRVPGVVVQTVALAWRYLFLLIDEARSIHRAVVSRGFRGRWIWQATTVGRMIGSLLVRSLERSERVHHAMLARSGNAVFNPVKAPPLKRVDAMFVTLTVVLLTSVRVAWGA